MDNTCKECGHNRDGTCHACERLANRMKWEVEYITENSTNILIVDENIEKFEWEAVAMGFPNKSLAERIVRLHNESIEEK